MPKGFTEREKNAIRERLLSEGKTLLERYGFHKTTVDDLVGAAGISKGAFYLFFGSKEELFFEVYETLETEFRAQVFTSVFRDGLEPRESFERFLRRTFEFLDEEPLARTVDARTMEILIRKLPPETLAKHQSRDDDYLTDFYIERRDAGFFVDMKPETFTAAMKVLYLLAMEHDVLGTSKKHAQELYISMLTNTLVR